jgi:hypothetical protein
METTSNFGGDNGGASKSVPQSIVDVYVYSAAFPTNYWYTLHELSELHKKRELNEVEMLKLKLLAVLLTEQLLGQLSVDSVKVLKLMREYDELRGGQDE